MREKRSTALLLIALAVSLINNLNPQNLQAETPEQVPPSSWSARVFALDDAAIKNADARYAISSVSAELKHLHWSLGMERQYFEWENSAAFPGNTDGRDPWEFLNQIHLGFAHGHIHSEKWMSEFMTGVTMGFEREIEDSFGAYLGGYGTYQVNQELILLLGVYYSRHQKVETDFDLIPILGVAIRPNATRGWSAQLGVPTTKACWHVDERTRLILELNALETGVTRLANDSPVQARGYAEFTSAAITLKIEKRLRNDFEITAGIGHSIERELKIYNADGDSKQSLDIERGPSIELAIGKTF